MSDEMGQRILQQFMDIFFLPEVARRQREAGAPAPFPLSAAQVVFHTDGRPTEVRLNEEIRAIAEIRLILPPGKTKAAGEPVIATEIAEVSQLRLTPDEDPDAGHATFVLVGTAWHIGFDFRYNKSVSRRHINAAREFLETARFARRHRYTAAFIDNLFSAAELLAKATLLSMPDPRLKTKATHKLVHSKYNRFAALGNIKPEHRKTFNRLALLRPRMRYVGREMTLSDDEAGRLLRAVSEMYRLQDRMAGE